MPELLTMQDLANGHLDVKALGEAANGDENTIVTTRTGNTYPSAKKAISEGIITLFENGGLPATPFATKALMTASALVDGDYAQVTDDTVNNGLYVKTAGAWVKSGYDPLTQAKSYTDAAKSAAITTAASDATTKANEVKAYTDVNKLDYTQLDFTYTGGNLIGSKTLRYEGLGVTNTGIVQDTKYNSIVLKVNAGQELFVNSDLTYFASESDIYFFAENPKVNQSQTAIAFTKTLTRDSASNYLYAALTVPANAKYMMVNEKINATNLRWSARNDGFSADFTAGAESLPSVMGVPLSDKSIVSRNIVNAVVASKATAEKMVGIEAGSQYVSAQLSLPTINLVSKDKYSYLIAVKPNTTYSVIQNSTSSTYRLRSFKNKPSVKTWTIADSGSDLSSTQIKSGQRRATFTTDATTTYVVLDFRSYADGDFVICEGAYNASMLDSFSVLPFSKTIDANVLNVNVLNSKTFSQSKNLVQSLTFGIRPKASATLNATTSSAVAAVSRPDAVDFKQHVGAYVDISADTTYTVSKQPSDKFIVVLLKADRSTGRIVVRDSSKLSATFTSAADEVIAYIYVSESYQQPLVQVELGDKVTDYQSAGIKFKDAALPLGAKLTDVPQQTDNTYIDLGIQTDKYFYAEDRTFTQQTVLDKYYDPLLADFPSLITKNVLSKDSTGTYDIYEYIFEPDNYEQTIFLTAGMHPIEVVVPFALGIFLNEVYRNPSKHEGLAYLRNKVKIVVIPVVNPWGFNQSLRQFPEQYLNANGVNPSRNFPERWDKLRSYSSADAKGTAPLSEVETRNIYNILEREKDELAFYFDMHTGQGYTVDSMIYWLDDDTFLRPALENVVSMRNDIVRRTLGREPVNEVGETQRATQIYHPWSVWGIPSAVIEYGAATVENMSNKQTTEYTNQMFNYIHYGLKRNTLERRKQAELNEHNKQFVSLYNTLSAQNDVVNDIWTYEQWQTELYDKLGLTRSVMGAASGSYDLVNYTHAPDNYTNTIVLSAGLLGKARKARKAVATLGFFAHKLMTDSNPHIIALRNSTRFIFIPVANPWGYDNASNRNGNDAQPFQFFSTSTQPESVALRSFIDSESIDLYVDLDSSIATDKPSGYADCQIIYTPKADARYNAVLAILDDKYKVPMSTDVAKFSSALAKSEIASYIDGKSIAYTYCYFALHIQPLRVIVDSNFEDYGYEANEVAYCAEVLLNSAKNINDRLTLQKLMTV